MTTTKAMPQPAVPASVFGEGVYAKVGEAVAAHLKEVQRDYPDADSITVWNALIDLLTKDLEEFPDMRGFKKYGRILANEGITIVIFREKFELAENEYPHLIIKHLCEHFDDTAPVTYDELFFAVSNARPKADRPTHNKWRVDQSITKTKHYRLWDCIEVSSVTLEEKRKTQAFRIRT